jgi:DNA helicase-2/ATP-dependent DNA helicase PcrA
VTCVGDDAQSIYSFRAATVRNILDFELRFPGAEVATLTRNYRSTAPILSATNAIIAEASERRDKELWTAREGGGRPMLTTCRDEAEQTLRPRILAPRAGTQLKGRPCLRAQTTAWRSRWSSAGATSPSTSTAGCASSRWRTSRTS